MAENLYACIYFPSDKTVSVILKSRCILRGEFKELGEVEVKWRVQGKQQTYLGIILRVCPKQEKHLLDRYSEELHPFITSSITEGREFTTEDLIRQWKPDQHSPVDVNTEAVPPPKKKRLESKTSKSDKPRKPNKDKARQKKSIDSSCALAAQEIIAFTPYNSVFPSVRVPQEQQLQDLQQEDDLLAPHSPHQRQQYVKPIETQQQQQRQYQPKQQQQNERLKQQQNQNQQQHGQHQQQEQHHHREQQQQYGQRQQQLQQQQPQQQLQQKQQQQGHLQRQQQPQQQQQQKQRHHGQRQQQEKQQQQQPGQRQQQQLQPTQQQQQKQKQKRQEHQDHQKAQRHRLNQQSILPLQEQQGQPLWDHSTQHSNMLQQSNQSYFNMLEDVVASSSKQGSDYIDSSDDFSCLGTTCAAITTAMTTLSDYNDGLDDFIEDPVETRQDFSLDDSGILISADSDVDDGNEMNHKEDPCSELNLLREKIRKLEKENDQLKARQSVYESTVPPPQVLDYLRRLLETFDGSHMLLQESNAAIQRDVPTSYMVKANFKPSEGEVCLLKGHNVFVPGNKLRQLINESKVKGPTHLLQKLIPLVFTVEELANSCGQGITCSTTNSKTQVNGGDLAKKPLDQTKTRVLKDYLLSFCIANEKDCPQPKHINEIFTQQVSYSRRKLQREKGKCAKYDQDSA